MRKQKSNVHWKNLVWLAGIGLVAVISARVGIYYWQNTTIDRSIQKGYLSSVITQSASSSSYYERKTIKTKRGDFLTDLVTIDLGKKNMKIISDTAAKADCKNNCPAKSLKDYVDSRHGFVGMHGAYFCPPDYSWCKSKVNSSFYPFYNTQAKFLINAGEIKWLQGSILVFDQNNKAYFFLDGRDFKSLEQFEEKYSTKIQALISNSPALIVSGKNIVASQKMDNKQLTTKGNRGGIGVKGGVVYLVIARKATVPDLASIMEALRVDTALNLDGGGSAALYWKGQYKVGPGRLLPTAIIFKEG